MNKMKKLTMVMAVAAFVAVGAGLVSPGEADAMYYGYVPNGMCETLEMAYWWCFLR
jgi:hypothetical protein